MTAIRKAVIVGGGIDAWMAANALWAAFGSTGLAIEVVETPMSVPAGMACASTPQFRNFLSLAGIAERDLLRAGQASFCLAQRNIGWRGEGRSFARGYGHIGAPIAGLPFLPFWLKARQHGMDVDLSAFSVGAIAAGNGRAPGAGASLDYGYQFDLAGAVALLAAAGRHRGVVAIAANDVTPNHDGTTGRLASLRLDDGRTVDGDIFIDATGGEARLSPALGSAERLTDDTDRLLLASAPRMQSPHPLVTVIALPHGWLSVIALRDRTAVCMRFAGALLSDDAAARAATECVGVPLHPHGIVPHAKHRRLTPWTGNCVAIGEAACTGSDLDGADLQRLQVSIAHLVSLFPIDTEMAVEAAIYNERVPLHFDRIEDVMGARRRRNGRTGEPFWDAARAAPICDPLAHRLSIFARRGLAPLYQDESFGEEDWQSLLIGMGVMPESYDPQIDRVRDDDAIGQMQSLLGAIRRTVEAMPAHEQALAAAMAARA
ncbi:tryptophan 7-halogenase [Sphingosinithalassobacter portus]|uniref:tryptophan 7-halogenase n=1 Tax=Stakelama portus TaxID=2676234 RepID=UPI000D6E3E41|nr:tryptophan 7-halogenase [Sphingosinithalassobacter portus]